MNYQNLKTGIQQVIRENGNYEITGQLLQQSLLAMVNALGDGYQFKGLAAPNLAVQTTDNRVFYIATTPGRYIGFGNLELLPNETALFLYDTGWRKTVLPFAALASLTAEISARELSEQEINERIDTIIAASDVKDIVGTYAELEEYDISKLGNNDIIKVLQDSTHDGAPSYYRFEVETQLFEYVGSESLTYTQTQTNELLALRELVANKVNTVVDDDDPTNHYPTVQALVDAVLAETTRAMAAEQAINQTMEDDFAKKNGQYDEFVSGYTKRIISPDGTVSQVPFITRTTAGNESVTTGSAEIEELRGNSNVWNNIKTTASSRYQLESRFENNTFILSANDPVPSNMIFSLAFSEASNIMGHRYLLLCDIIPNENTGEGIYMVYNNPNSSGLGKDFDYGNIGNTYYCLATRNDTVHPSAAGIWIRCYAKNAGDFASIPVDSIQVVDLTRLYGAGNEPTTFAEYVAKRPKIADPYAFNAGEIISVDVTAIETIGFNAYNNTTGKAVVLGGNQYQITGAFTSLTMNGETITPDANGLFTPATNGEITVVGGNATDTCIHLVWSGYRNGEFEPFVKHTLDLSWYKQIMYNGAPLFADGKLRGAGSAYDEVRANKAIKRIVKYVFTGNENWSFGGAASNRFMATIPNNPIGRSLANGTNIIQDISGALTPDNVTFGSTDKIYIYTGTTDGNLYIQISCGSVLTPTMTPAEVNAIVAGKTAYVELATPIEVDYEPKTMNYQMDDFGIETFIVNTPSAPVANRIFYMANLVDEIRNMPKNYQSQQSMDNLLSALGSVLGLTITKTYNEQTKAYTYVVVQQQPETIE